MNTDRMVWIDLETFGLDPLTCPVMEVGFKITDRDLNVIDDFQQCVWETYYSENMAEIKKSAPFVYDMHNAGHPGYSALWAEAEGTGLPLFDTTANLLHWLESHGIDRGDPLCGSSVSFDRRFLHEWFPKAEEMFSYRNIDTSSVKELCARYNPGLYARLDEVTDPKKFHRVLPDIEDTIAEFQFYRDEFLMTEAFFGEEA